MEALKKLNSGREVCPKCKKKGLGYASHPHAYGYKNYDQAHCRYCGGNFKLKTVDSRSFDKCIDKEIVRK